MKFRLSIPGRPRSKNGAQAGQGNVFAPPEIAAEEAHIKKLARETMGKTKPFIGPVRLFIEFVFEVPVSWSPLARELAHEGRIWFTGRPDLDNMEKLIGDALNAVVYVDDSQIVEKSTRKRYGAGERVDIIIEELVQRPDDPTYKRALKRSLEPKKPKTPRKKRTGPKKPTRIAPSIERRIR